MVLCFLLISLLGWQETIQTAQSSFDAGDYSNVVKILLAARNRDPRDASINYWLARSYYEMEDYDNAIKCAEAAVALAPQNAGYYRWLGRIYGGKAEHAHSFFLARKVKEAFQTAVHLDPKSIEARRDLMQYLVEAPWIVGGSKAQAREQIEAISKLDALEARLARAAYFSADKKWKDAEAEYLAIIDQHPARIEPYMEAADFFTDRKDAENLDRAVGGAQQVNSRDPRVGFYKAVLLILRGRELPAAGDLLKAYIAKVPQRSDYPSHHQAAEWLRRIGRAP